MIAWFFRCCTALRHPMIASSMASALVACGLGESTVIVGPPIPAVCQTDPRALHEAAGACQARCHQGVGEACVELARIYVARRELEAALRVLGEGCKLGGRAACARLSEMAHCHKTAETEDPLCGYGAAELAGACGIMPGPDDPCRAARAEGEEIELRECERGGVCAQGGSLAQRCSGELRPSPSACRGYARVAFLSCSRSDAAWCVRMVEPLEVACGKGSREDCARLDEALAANAARFCPSRVTDEDHALDCRKACDVWNPEACIAEAEIHMGRRGGSRRSRVYAWERLYRACGSSKGRRGCVELAQHSAEQHVCSDRFGGDYATCSATFLVKACTAHVEVGCTRLVEIVSEKKKAAPELAIDAVRRLCAAGTNPAACARLAAAGL